MRKNEILRKKRIFIGFNDAGAPGIYSFTRVLRRYGYKIDFWGYVPKWIDVRYDVRVSRPRNIKLQRIQGIYLLLKSLFKYDIFHFNFGRTFFSYKYDHLILKLFRKKIVNTFRGSDVFDVERSIKEYGKESPYHKDYQLKGSEHYKKIEERKKFIISRSDRIILIGPWMADSVGKYDQIIPYARDIDGIRKSKTEPSPNQAFTIMHAPTDEEKKGTRYVVQAVEELRGKGVKVNLVLADKISRKDLYKKMSVADLIIDQLLIGWYGGLSVEAMALGKPVVCYLKEEYVKLVPFGKNIPIINANKDNLAEVLERLIKNRKGLAAIGKRGYEFVKKVHDAKIIAEQYKKVYESLL
ncbi:MAG TPA: glycosyltransferase family 4 protein [Candidatus Nanoarchaeia archaeon]